MSYRDDIDRDNDFIGAFYWRCSLACGLVAIVCILALCVCGAHGQSVLLPCYEAKVAKRALAQCPKGKEAQLVLLMNVNSGPHWVRDKAYGDQVDAARARGVRVAFYIDALAGVDAKQSYSPVLFHFGDTWRLETVKGKRDKTALEIRNERDAWLTFYCRKPEDRKDVLWLIDDVNKGQTWLFKELATWSGGVILNPGTAMAWPKELPKCSVIIHEDESPWRRTLSRDEATRPTDIGVMGLKVSQASLPAFKSATAGMGLVYASPLSDSEGCYNSLPAYFTQLFR